ncbi:uncharacterized protein KZ484_012012 [Pholidichthys leucotaenia]
MDTDLDLQMTPATMSFLKLWSSAATQRRASKLFFRNFFLLMLKSSRGGLEPGPHTLFFRSVWRVLTAGHCLTTCPVVHSGDVVKNKGPHLLEPPDISFTGSSALMGGSWWQFQTLGLHTQSFDRHLSSPSTSSQ